MSCSKILDDVYEYSGGEPTSAATPMPLLLQIRVALHTMVCPDCAQEIERFEVCRDILREDFFPPSPGIEDSVMDIIAAEKDQRLKQVQQEEAFADTSGFSTRGWVIAGLVILVSFVTVFFGLDFNKVAKEAGISFLLPMGITAGIVLTSYGALFIGSHLKELSERFGL